MKKSIIMSFIFLGLTTVSFAQVTKGSVTYSMEMTSDNPDMAMAASMMAGSTMVTSFMPGKTRTDVTMGMLGKMSTIVDEKSKKILMLTDMMGSKYAVQSSTDEVTKDVERPNYTIEKTKETKDVSGYKCTKSIMRTEDGTEITGWYTTDIKAVTAGQTYYNDQMPGFPLELTTSTQGMSITFKATSVDKSADKSAFDMSIPAGYEVKSMEELMMSGEE